MKKTDVKITRFETECFWIDIVETETDFEAWLQSKEIGISKLMYGIPKHQTIGNDILDVDFDFFCAMIEADKEDYIYEYYRTEYNGWED